MELPTSFYDVASWIATITIILLFTLEILSPHFGRTNIVIDKRRLRQIALTTTLMAIFVIMIGIFLQLFL